MSSNTFRTLGGIAVAAALLLTTATAHAQDVSFNAMPGTDFSKFKTYKWVKIEGTQAPDQIMDAQIKTAIDTQLATKGMTKTEDDNADMYVGYQVSVDKEKQFNSYSTGMGGPGWGWGAGYYGAAGGMSSTTTTSSTLFVGTLGLDMYDRAAKQLVWRGRATKTLDPKAKPEKREKNLNKAMAKLLKKFPPPPAKS